ncbi:PHD finger protein 3 [Galdieria sulphuraria]|nr:PHD finger protein 3 [Galdieria sulphuraria]
MQERVAENIREKAKNVLNQILLENLEDTGVDIDKTNISKIAIDIENALFEKYFKADYLEQLRSLTFNLRGKRNLDLKRAIVMSDISPTRLAEMTADELASKSMREERKRREQESFARAVIRDPTDVGIMKGMNSTEVLPQRSEDAYENGQIFPTDNSLQEACREDVEAGIEDSGVQGSLPVNKEIIHEMDSIQSCLHVNETTQQKNNVEAQKSSSLTLSSLEFSMSNSLDDKFQQFASSMGEPESNKRNRSILRGSTTDAIRSKRRTAVWQGKITFDKTISFSAMAFYLVGASNYAVLPGQMNVIGRTELTSTIEFVKGLEYSTSREFSVVYFKPKDSRDEGGFKELIDFLSRRKRAGVLFQTGQSEAYILPPGKITCRVHEYGNGTRTRSYSHP